MTPEQFRRLEALFHELEGLPAEERYAQACERCSDDPEVLAELEKLLASASSPNLLEALRESLGDLLQHDAGSSTATGGSASRPAQVTAVPEVEGYEYVKDIARGGQGLVFQAIQKSTKRKVAIKVLLHGSFASKAARRRFAREVELVAHLQHPNIISVFDTGVTAGGHPYFVMDYVRGLPLHRHVREHDLSLNETMELLCKVCDAVRYAHDRGVIHRDLKPANILVDADGNPKVLDFGLAKHLVEPVDTVVSLSQELYGTLPYLSPEQARGNPDEIDGRTDIYALGVVAYQLLTGEYPYPVAGHIGDVLKHIAETPPAPPSRSWTRDSGVRRRRSERQSAERCPIDADAQAIILKALEKERKYRYQSVTELARDIRHYLEGEQISVQSHSLRYRLRWQFRRHRRGALAATAILVIAVTIGVLSQMWGAQSAAQRERARNRELADQRLLEAEALLAQRTDLDRAADLLEDALVLAPGLERALIQRGRLRVITGLAARFDQKTRFIDEALMDFELAHVNAGGTPFATTDQASPADDAGSLAALWAAVDTLLLTRRTDEARPLLHVLERRSHNPDQTPFWKPIYDPAADPLLEPASTAESPDEAGRTPATKATIYRVLPTRHLGSLHPVWATSYAMFVAELMYDPLFVHDRSMAMIANPNVVQDVKVENECSYLVTLHPDLRWHDGEPFTASDVVFTWSLFRDAPLGRPFELVEAPDPATVRFVHREVRSTAEWDMGFGILPQHVANRLRGPDGNELLGSLREYLDASPIGNGPFRLVSEPSSGQFELERWPEYPGRQPYIDRVVFVLAPSPDEIARGLAEGRLHECRLRSEDFQWTINGESFDDRIYKVVEDCWNYDYVCWNLAHPFLADSRARRAIAHAVPIERLCEEIGGGLYRPCTGIFGSRSWGQSESAPAELMVFAPDIAKGLLDEAEWRVGGGHDEVRTKAGERASFGLLVPTEVPSIHRIAIQIRNNLAAVGIEVQIELVPWRALRDRRDAGEFDAAILSVITHPLAVYDADHWKTGGPTNHSGYSNAEVDRLFDEAARTRDAAQRAALLRRIQEITYHDQPHLFLWYKPSLWAFNRRLRGVEFSPRGPWDFYPGPRAWWLAE